MENKENENKNQDRQTFLQTLATALNLKTPLPQPIDPVEAPLPPVERWLEK